MKNVLLINGLPRSGKDTLADYLVDKYNYTKLSFAAPMKAIISNTFDISLDELDAYKNRPYEFIVETKFLTTSRPNGILLK